MNSFTAYLFVLFSLAFSDISYGQYGKLNFTYGILPVSVEEEKSYDRVIKAKVLQKLLDMTPSESIPNYSMVMRPQFVIYSSDVSATAPPYYTSDMALNIVISDMAGSVIFGSIDYPIKGSGRSEEKSIVNGVKSLNFNTAKFSEFIKLADAKVAAYIEDKAATIISEAKVLKEMGKNLNKEQANVVLSRLGMLVQHDINKSEAWGLINDISKSLGHVIKVEKDHQDTISYYKEEAKNYKELYDFVSERESKNNSESKIDSAIPASWNEFFLGIAHKLSFGLF